MIKELLQEKYKMLFAPQIIFRGRNYFENDKVKELYKDKDSESYMAKVEGSDFGKCYDVRIILDDNEAKMSCTCPCIENCKHEVNREKPEELSDIICKFWSEDLL